MQLIIIAAFALLLSMPQRGWVDAQLPSTALALAAVAAQILLPAVVSAVASLIVSRRIRADRNDESASRLQALSTAAAHLLLVSCLVFSMVATSWVPLVRYQWGLNSPFLLDELVLMAPFLVAILAGWIAAYPGELVLRARGMGRSGWGLLSYLIFNVRHQLLLMAVPLTMVLLARDLAEPNRRFLARLSGAPWAAEACVIATAGMMFLIAPLLMRYIWATAKLAPGQLRQRLETLCKRAGLRYREILLWRTDGMVVNAAVMGLVGRVRYVMLSDGLVDTLAPQQVEAVFGHEAGHIKYHHLVFYIFFAAATTLVVGGGLELCYRVLDVDLAEPELWALGGLGVMWLVSFGWVSRRFERQADLFGARCLVDGLIETGQEPNLSRAAAADIYAATLERIALLNGISPESRSWRHSSIASRMAFVRRCSSESGVERRFSRNLLLIKVLLVAVTVFGSLISAYLYWPMKWRFWA